MSQRRMCEIVQSLCKPLNTPWYWKHKMMPEQETLYDKTEKRICFQADWRTSKAVKFRLFRLPSKERMMACQRSQWAGLWRLFRKRRFHREKDRIPDWPISKRRAKWTEKRSTWSFESNELSKRPNRGASILSWWSSYITADQWFL